MSQEMDTESYTFHGSATLYWKNAMFLVWLRVLRVVIKDYAFHMRILLICLDVSDGIVTFGSKEGTDFVEVSHNQEGFSLICEKWISEINLIENRQQSCDTENYYSNDQHFERETICYISIDHHCSDSHDIKGSDVFH